jgi:hypothetical protein
MLIVKWGLGLKCASGGLEEEGTSPCKIRGGEAGGSDKERDKLAQNETDEHPPLLQEALYPCGSALSHQPNQPFLRHLCLPACCCFLTLSLSLSLSPLSNSPFSRLAWLVEPQGAACDHYRPTIGRLW